MKTKTIIERDYLKYAIDKKDSLKKKYFDLFYARMMQSIESDDLTEQDKDYLIKQLYYKGTICILKRIDGKPLLCPYASNSWNINDYPVDLNLINKRNVQGIFPKSMRATNMKDAVVGYIRPSKCSIAEFVNKYIDEITHISVTMRINSFTQRLPFAIPITPANKTQAEMIMQDLFDGVPVLFADMVELENIGSVQGGLFNIDKLRAEKEALENELKTQLGINNNNNIKKERMIQDEVNANNDEIASSSDVYLSPLEAFSKDIEDVLGFHIKFKYEAPITSIKSFEEEDEEDE